ncbi:MAG: universal stress protein, partial [Rhodospirillaceae bacterium]|nr:universal stress protein [Rhodospirillaceae bacterium]
MMAIKTILACVCSGESSENVLEAAWRIASPFDAHIEALHVRADPRGLVPYTGEGMDGSMIEEIMEVTEREGGERSEAAKKA